jgi:hypothetical protein
MPLLRRSDICLATFVTVGCIPLDAAPTEQVIDSAKTRPKSIPFCAFRLRQAYGATSFCGYSVLALDFFCAF